MIPKNERNSLAAATCVIMYLNGELDIYNPIYDLYWVVEWWNDRFDEGFYLGCDMNTADGIRKYLSEIA